MLLAVICFPYSFFGQTTTVWKAVVRDGSTRKPLSNVLVCVDQDTIGVRSNSAGEFQVSVKQNSGVYFRKQGYTWKKVDFAKEIDNVELSASVKSSLSYHFFFRSPSADSASSVEVFSLYIDGKLLPKEEWDDINWEMIDLEKHRNTPGQFLFNNTLKRIEALYFETKR